MKRALTLAMTLAVIGGLMTMGSAGTAAAQDIQISGDGGDGGDAVNVADVNQENTIGQEATINAPTIGANDDESDDRHKDDNSNDANNGGSASVGIDQSAEQQNNAEVTQTAEAGDGGDGGAVDVNLDLGNGLV
ncbi:hypothetical protein QA609_23530 [Natronococcus sp. A-GB7]|nr:hypothetical protein [Natronococcus sp. A-GB7]MDG5821753.1 hypothetical protein [Natronococcus sp. A-GB7]